MQSGRIYWFWASVWCFPAFHSSVCWSESLHINIFPFPWASRLVIFHGIPLHFEQVMCQCSPLYFNSYPALTFAWGGWHVRQRDLLGHWVNRQISALWKYVTEVSTGRVWFIYFLVFCNTKFVNIVCFFIVFVLECHPYLRKSIALAKYLVISPLTSYVKHCYRCSLQMRRNFW